MHARIIEKTELPKEAVRISFEEHQTPLRYGDERQQAKRAAEEALVVKANELGASLIVFEENIELINLGLFIQTATLYRL